MRISHYAKGLSIAAVLSLTASPALADGWGGYGHHRRHHDDTGWIVGGILGIGLIAAIAASSSNKAKRERETRDRDYRYPDGDYRDGRDDRDQGARYGGGNDDRQPYSGSSRGIDNAVDACVGEVERGNSARVESVDSVGREGGSWRIYGQASGGRGFSCSVDTAGRVSDVSVTARGSR
ncbi:MAG: hypothetical protein AB7F98_06265 [Novosphingobium sp.]